MQLDIATVTSRTCAAQHTQQENIKRHTMKTVEFLMIHYLFMIFILIYIVKGNKNVNEDDSCGKNVTRARKAACEGAAFLTAAYRGNIEKIEEMLRLPEKNTYLGYAENSLSAGLRHGYTALIWAAEKNNTEMVRTLVEAAAPVARVSSSGFTAMYHLASQGNLESVKLLLRFKAPPDTITKFGSSPLLEAARNGYTEVVRVLVKNGANPNLTLPDTEYFPMYYAAKLGDMVMVKALVDADANVNLQTHQGVTALAAAVAWGHDQAVRTLLDDRADPNLLDKLNTSALHRAAYYGYTNILDMLLGYGAKINVQNREGRTPLHFAAMEGQIGAVRALLTKCADTTIRDIYGRNAYEAAKHEVDMLSKRRSPSTPRELSKLKEAVTILERNKPCFSKQGR